MSAPLPLQQYTLGKSEGSENGREFAESPGDGCGRSRFSRKIDRPRADGLLLAR
jgi:hypothetical protein